MADALTAPDAGPFQALIDAAAKKYGLDPDWFGRLLYQENHFQPQGTSPAGAQGIAQFMPGTAARYGVNVNDPASSIDGSAHYLSDNLNRFNGNQGLASAAYNWGEGNVDKWLSNGGTPPKETQNYVQDITGRSINDWRASLPSSPPGTTLSSTPATQPSRPFTPTPTQAPGPIDPSIIARGGVSPAIPSAAPATSPAGASSGILPGFTTADASNKFLKGANQFANAAAGQDGSSQQAPRAPPMPQPQPPHMPQTFGQTLNSPAPLQWGPGTPGSAGAGTPIAPASPVGTSLSSLQQLMLQMGYGGLGYG